MSQVPQHIAFIMDGNRRWAMQNKLALLFGHDKGAHQIEPLVEYAAKHGVLYVTFWAFSTENWQRSENEVTAIMEVFRRMFRDPMVGRMKKNDVKFGVIGDTTKFPQDIQENIERLLDETKNNKKITVTIALNYGGRDEILRAVRKVSSSKYKVASIENEELENIFQEQLYTSNMPDPDLLIRTGGERRLSGFLPWQTVYTELYFSDVLWPDFGEKELQKVLNEYSSRERRFGK